jgi:hypothetical protein
VSETVFSKPVEDSVARVAGEVAVGEDLVFQRKWWVFERVAWIGFTLILIADLAGAFGRGPLAKAERRAPDGSIEVKYDRIERTGTPSILTVNLGQSAIRDGRVHLYVSESVVKELGNQRVIPSPESTVIGDGGLLYGFPATRLPASVEFALQPTGPGMRHFEVRAEGMQPVDADVFVTP